MKYRIYRITLNNGDWYEVASESRWRAITSLVATHYETLTVNEFRKLYKPRTKATSIFVQQPDVLYSNTYEVE